MIRSVLNQLITPLLLPVLFLTSAWLILPFQNLLPASLSGLTDYAPYFLLFGLIALGIGFNRGKVVMSAILLSVGLYLFNFQQLEQLLSMEQTSFLDFTITGLIPINLALINALKEKGFLNWHGVFRCSILMIQGIAVYLCFAYPDTVTLLISQQFMMQILHYPYLAPIYNMYTPLLEFSTTHSVQLLVIISLLLMFSSAYYYKNQLSFGLLGIFFGYTIGVLLSDMQDLLAFNVMAGSLLMFTALLRDSYNMAYRDELTGLPQRRALNEQLDSLGSKYTLSMLDVDHFKKFNDTHGHDIGDQVLQMVAGKIAKVKGGGRAYRYGGEEFCVVFTSRDVADAAYHLDEVRKSIENYEMVIRDKERPEDPGKQKKGLRKRGSYHKATKKVSVTISIGVAGKEKRNQQPEDVLKNSDKALYSAKEGGRNQVTIFQHQ